jgi:hypothetical protein
MSVRSVMVETMVSSNDPGDSEVVTVIYDVYSFDTGLNFVHAWTW